MALLARPLFSVVTVTYGNREVTERCLESLDATFGERLGHDVELVLVDNASPDDTADLLRSWENRATVILLDKNRNYAGGNNVGARTARGEVLVLLNNDTEVATGSLDALVVQALEPGVGISGCRLLYPNGTIQHGGCAWQEHEGRVLPFHLFQHESGDLPAALATFDGDAVTGACLAIRRELFLELGGFDELFVNGLEDMDLCVRVRLAGHRVVYRGDIAVIHEEGATRSRRPNDEENQRRFVRRYHSVTREDRARFADQFDAVQPPFMVAMHPGDSPNGTTISVEGEVIGLAYESGEARALLAALERAGLLPATREWQPVQLVVPSDDREQRIIQFARRRPKRRTALIVQAPIGHLGIVDLHSRAILRLAQMPAVDVSGVAALWAAYPALADQLIAAGLDSSQVDVLPPLIPEVRLGSGGEGLLVILPAHHTARSGELLCALAPLADSVRIRLLPTVATEGLAALAGELAPSAELLVPISSESVFACLAGECDAVVQVDPRDRFERRALIAAAAGAASVHLPAGAAAAVLGDELAFDGSTEVLRVALSMALTRSARKANAKRVVAACGQEATGDYLNALVERAAIRSRPTRTVAAARVRARRLLAA